MLLNRRFVLAAVVSTLLLNPPTSPLSGQNLTRAVRTGRMETVRDLLAKGPEQLDVPDESGYTPLRWAGIRGEGEIALLLLEGGADPNTVGADGGTPIHGAAHHDDSTMMAALLEAGGDITIHNRWGRTPLHVAARRGCLEVATLLLDAGADPNATTNLFSSGSNSRGTTL
jgi:ankyrin repeat protein